VRTARGPPRPDREDRLIASRQRDQRRDTTPERLERTLAALGAPRGAVPLTGLSPMLATLVDDAFSDPGWLFEIKYDGVRVLAERSGGRVTLQGRHGQDFTVRYPEVVTALAALPVDRFVIDGEVVAVDEEGRPSFQRLQNRMHLTRAADIERVRRTVPVTGVFFDALALGGHDLRGLALVDRKACLQQLLAAGDGARYGGHVAETGAAFLDAACRKRLEGIVAKRAASPYVGGRSRDWLKIKCQLRQEFVIGGYTDPQGARALFGALHLGLYEGPRLVYVSKVGTGFDDRTLTDVWSRLGPLARRTSPFDEGTPAGRGHHWVEPRLVCEVRFTEWTEDGGLRHPAFLGLRADKAPHECRREIPAPVDAVTVRGGARRNTTPARSQPALTNLDKVFWPEDGLTKGDLITYYDTVAPLLLPYLRDRPVVLTRHPDGIHAKSFYQKDAPPSVPAWVRTVPIRAEEPPRDIEYIVIDDIQTLRYVVNLGTIPIHLWASRVASLEQPDWMVLDLDPKGAPFTDVVAVALATRRVLDRVQVPSHVKTSGKTGLHVLVPLGARHGYQDVRALAQILAALVVQEEPRRATIARPLHARGGKVYVDWGQNGRGQTVVAPFSVRPLPGAPVSCPLAWDEVTPSLDPGAFTMRTAPARFARVGDPMAPVLGPGIDLPAALQRIEREFGAASIGASSGRQSGVVRAPRRPGRGTAGRTPGPSRSPRA
jgi:bifunctional non-homologous end joining protein LigD